MKFETGLIVRSKAGHDKNCFYVVLSVSAESALLCNGANKTLANPKSKKLLHLAPTKTVIPNHLLKTNQEIYNSLLQFCRK